MIGRLRDSAPGMGYKPCEFYYTDILHILVEIAKLLSVDGRNAKQGALNGAPRFAAIIQCLVRPVRSSIMIFLCHSLSRLGASCFCWI
jgi:hypothetical protein